MEIILKRNSGADLSARIINILAGFQLSAIQKTLSDAFENLPSDNPINYVGELNKNDVMH